MSYFIERWKVKGTLLSPLHIGCGETLDPFRCVYDEGAVHEFDLTAALRGADAQTRNLLEARLAAPIGNEVQADEVVKLLRELPWREHIVRSYGLSSLFSQKFDRDPIGSLRGAEFQLFAHTSLNGQRIVPGSGLKGALRTGAVAEKGKGIDAGSVNIRRPQDFEQRALGYARMEEDPFGEWKVADAVISGESELVPLDVHRYEGAKGVTEYPFYCEVIRPGKGHGFECTLNRVKRGKVALGSQLGFESWLKMIKAQSFRAFDLAYYDFEYPRSFTEATVRTIEAIAGHYRDIEEQPLACVVRLGRFSGFLSLTVDKQRVLTEHRGHRQEMSGDDANPLTRALTRDGWPFGFVKLEFEKVA